MNRTARMQNLNCPGMTAARRLFADALAASWKIFLRRMKHEATIRGCASPRGQHLAANHRKVACAHRPRRYGKGAGMGRGPWTVEVFRPRF
ncbi:hypothetical protein [Lysobacter gummosus]|uniref:hypothetical protein n=1 Tax=Lysobacter gummosus TaxID=262324 RepID=UPI00363852AD